MPETAKTYLGLVFGGRTGEHEVSCHSAASMLANLDRERYEILPVRIGRDGVWATAPGDDLPDGTEAIDEWLLTGFRAAGDHPMSSMLPVLDRLRACDVVFPAMHGPYGEDGTVQTVLAGLRIPFVGNGVTASALSMDKEYTKKIAADLGIAMNAGVVLRDTEQDVTPQDRDRLGLPVFVKPAREGSSIGTSKVDGWEDLPAAVAAARLSDRKVMVESASSGREIDIGVLQRPDGTLSVSPPLEIMASDGHTFFDYKAKYGDATTVLDVPATVDPDVTERLGEASLRLFRALGCSGLLRADFFVDPEGGVVFNEVNTFPGFTSASQYPRMWAAAGLGYGALLDVLIDTALSGN